MSACPKIYTISAKILIFDVRCNCNLHSICENTFQSKYAKSNNLSKPLETPVNIANEYFENLHNMSATSQIDSINSNLPTHSALKQTLSALRSASNPASELIDPTQWPKFRKYWERIRFLKLEGEDEGILINRQSIENFWKFVIMNGRICTGDVVLTNDGNLRAVWRDGQQTFLGLQFMEDNNIQFVIFKKRRADSPVSRVTGSDSFQGILKQIKAFDLDSLICE